MLFGLPAVSLARHLVERKPNPLDSILHQISDAPPNAQTPQESGHFRLHVQGPRSLKFDSILKNFAHLDGFRRFSREPAKLQIPVVNGGPKSAKMAAQSALIERMPDPLNSILHRISDALPNAQTVLESGHFGLEFRSPQSLRFDSILKIFHTRMVASGIPEKRRNCRYQS